MAREKRQPGVELHGNGFRYRMRVMTDGQKRVAKYKRWPFVEGEKARKLSATDPMRRENALANANTFAIQDRHQRKSPRYANGAVEAQGTLLEWLLRYQAEALEQRQFHISDIGPMLEAMERRKGEERPAIPQRKLTFHVQPRASAEHDKSQIRTMIRLAKTEDDIDDMLHAHVESLGGQHIHRLLGLWSKGKAKPSTKRRLVNTLSSVWGHHASFYDMRPAKPWSTVKIPGDGSKPKARALTSAELAKVEAELDRLHPSVRGAITFLRWTGARRSEAANLTWQRLAWDVVGKSSPAAHFERTKAARGSYKERFTYLEPGAIEALARMVTELRGEDWTPVDPDHFDWRAFKWPKKGWVFAAPQDPKSPVTGGTIYQAFVRCVAHAGVDHASPHHLRHTRATVLTATVPQAIAQELLGHDDASSFAIYRHLAEAAGYMVRDRVGNLVSADSLQTEAAISEAIRKLSKEARAKLLMGLMAD